MNNTCFIITGPTAAGKTALAIELARTFRTDIISADSRQCFRELNIGVAKPSEEELRLVKHYFINSHSIHDEVNAAVFEQYALQAVCTIFQSRPVAVMVGGTGLYIKAFCEGIDDIPPVSPAIREAIVARYEQHGISWLQQQVREADPLYYASGEVSNPQRLIRALEVMQGTGKSIRHYQQGKKITRDFAIVKIGLELNREKLHRNINSRVDKMMEAGLLEEVHSLLPWRQLNALQTVGYSELFNYLDGHCSLPEAVEAIKTHTRQYAKRQMTWFRKDPHIQWFSPDNLQQIIDYCQANVH
jgi:tRNA dimethylallyltransferase